MSLSASVCSRLQNQHETIQELLNGFSEDELLQHIHSDKWSAFELVAYTATHLRVYMQPMQIVQYQNAQHSKRYVADNGPAFIVSHV
jgi:hypothetical protein